MFIMEFSQLRLGKPRMQLHLVQHWNDTRSRDDLLQRFLVEVSHADGSDLPHALQTSHLLKGLHIESSLWPRPVDQVEV